MKQICKLTDKIILGTDGLSDKPPRLTARAIVRNQDGLYAVMYSDKFKLHSLPGGGVEDGEDALTALRREVYEETGCVCDKIQELGIVAENRASLDYTQINYYFVVTTTHTSGENHLTEAEQANRTVVLWRTFDEMVRLIDEQEFDRVQGKYLKARDVAALREYTQMISTREFAYFLYENFDADEEANNPYNPRNILGKETDAILTEVAQLPVSTCLYNDCCDKYGAHLVRKLIDGGILRTSGTALSFDCPIFLREDAAVLHA